LKAALHAAEPGRLVRAHLRVTRGRLFAGGGEYRLERGRVVVLAVGKAAAAMAAAAE